MGSAATRPLSAPSASLSGAAIAQLRGRLRSAFGKISPHRVAPLDRLVLGLAGVDGAGGQRASEALKRSFRPWFKLAAAPVELVAAALRPVEPDLGRALARAQRLIGAMKRLLALTGGMSLDFLAEKPAEDAVDWLQDRLGAPALLAVTVLALPPIRHRLIHLEGAGQRALSRWTGEAEEAAAQTASAAALQEHAPDDWQGEDLAELAALLQSLGEAVCLPARPDCAGCPLQRDCASALCSRTEQKGNSDADGLSAFLRRRLRRLEGARTSEAASAGVPLDGVGLEVLPWGLTPGVHQAAPAGAGHAAAALVLVAATLTAAQRRSQPSASRSHPARSAVNAANRLILVQEADAVAEHGDLFGPGLAGLGLDPQAVATLRVGSGAEALRVVDEALKHRAAPVVAVELRRGEGAADLMASRRLGLSARRAGVWLWLLTPDLSNTSAALTRWRVGAAPSGPAGRRRLGAPAFSLELTRNRHGPLGAWTFEWDIDEHRFRPPQAPHRSAVAGSPAARPFFGRFASGHAGGALSASGLSAPFDGPAPHAPGERAA